LTIKVFLADDHHLMVEGFRLTLKNYGIDVVDVAYSPEGLRRKFLESNADVLVVDVRFEGAENCNGLDVCAEILGKNKSAKIVVFSQFDDEWIVDRTYKLGALAFVRKDEHTDLLVQAIKTISTGEAFFSPVAAQLVASTVVRGSSPERVLDEKELRAFTLIADGYSMAEAGEAMGFSYRTISAMVKSIREKMGVESFADFTKLAIKHGLVNLEVKKKN
jgi:two-component system invasion response regulator UvrY